MKTDFKVKVVNNEFQVNIRIDERTVWTNVYETAEKALSDAPALVEKAKISAEEALALEERLNTLLNNCMKS